MAFKRDKSTYGSGLRGAGRTEVRRQRVMAGPVPARPKAAPAPTPPKRTG